MRLGTQPGRWVIAESGRRIREIADEIGVKESHLRGTLSGYNAPSQRVRSELPRVLNVPLTDIFTSEMLSREYTGPRRPARTPAGVE